MSGTPPNYFSTFKYYRDPQSTSYIDLEGRLADWEQMVVSFMHEPTGHSVFFKAYITAFNESYASDWVSETVFGRTDPIQHFKQTTRRISLALKVPAASSGEAYDNLGRVQQLTQYLYPNYTGTTNDTSTLSQNPFVRLKVMNLARKIITAGGVNNMAASLGRTEDKKSAGARYTSYKSTAHANNGLLGTITSLNIIHNLENSDIGVIQHSSNAIFSKAIEINLDFVVIHETQLGWNDSGNFMEPLFPYGVDPIIPETIDYEPPLAPAPVKVDDVHAVWPKEYIPGDLDLDRVVLTRLQLEDIDADDDEAFQKLLKDRDKAHADRLAMATLSGPGRHFTHSRQLTAHEIMAQGARRYGGGDSAKFRMALEAKGYTESEYVERVRARSSSGPKPDVNAFDDFIDGSG